MTDFDEMKDRCFGIPSDGRPPGSSNEVKLSVGSTAEMSLNRVDMRVGLTKSKHRIVRKVHVST